MAILDNSDDNNSGQRSVLAWEVIIATEIAENVRLSWEQLLHEAATKAGTLHEAYSRFWNYSLGNQVLALIQCRERGIEPGALASFNRWKELGRHVRKCHRALELCMPLKLKSNLVWKVKRGPKEHFSGLTAGVLLESSSEWR